MSLKALERQVDVHIAVCISHCKAPVSINRIVANDLQMCAAKVCLLRVTLSSVIRWK